MEEHVGGARLRVSAGAPLLGSIARLNEQKGHRHLLDAAAVVFARRPDARVLIAGDGDLLPALQEQARTLGIGDRVIFAGHRTDVRDLLGALDVEPHPIQRRLCLLERLVRTKARENVPAERELDHLVADLHRRP